MKERPKVDYLFKSQVLKSGLCEKVRQSSYKEHAIVQALENGIYKKILDDNSVPRLEEIFGECAFSGHIADFNEAIKINSAFYHRVKRLKTRVSKMLKKGPCLFLTFNFTDEALEMDFSKRRDIVRRFLKQYNTLYIANADYGSTDEYIDRHGNVRKGTGREHYHALIQTDFVNTHSWLEKGIGRIDVERVRIKQHEEDVCKLSKYISKLTNHAIKETTKRSAIIYSR